MSTRHQLFNESVQLLKELISIPSYSKEEDKTADAIEQFLYKHQKQVNRKFNNIWSVCDNCRSNAPVLLLNSHHDTVVESGKWTYDPFEPVIIDDRLYGLGSNDAGASVVSLMATFLHLSRLPKLPYRLVLALTAEEEISGKKGISSILDELGTIDLAIVGEPTEMQMAVAEKGLIVLDCSTEGRAGHAARDEGVNAIYTALQDIEFIRNYQFQRSSDLLGPVKLSVTQINAGHQHNVVPSSCEFVVDVRTNEHYTNQEVVQGIQKHVSAKIKPRSLRLNSSGISMDHPIIKRGQKLGLPSFGSPTLSDQALMNFDSVKIGPGKSSRSHTADEFILLSEIEQGIGTYINLITELNLHS
jgi:acetylornithine deacetylase